MTYIPDHSIDRSDRKVAQFSNAHRNKLCVSFKASPQLKLRLFEAADKAGSTTSEFIEMLLQDFKDLQSFNKAVLPVDHRIEKLTEENRQLKTHIDFYEQSKLSELYSNYKGRNFQFTDVDGNFIDITIDSIKDAFTLLIHLFKSKP